MIEILELFASLGIPVFPLSPGTKIPYKNTNGVHDATSDITQIKQWWFEYPNSNWAMATGKKSGIIVFDIDPRNGGIESLRTRVNQYGELPETPTVKTGGGGFHYYFRYPLLSNIRNGEILDGVDIKTDGGYVLIPGSITDGEYQWAKNRDLTDIQLAEMPGWILELASNKKNNFFDSDHRVVTGSRNNYLTSIAGSMRRRGLTENSIRAALLEENKTRCEPPLPVDEVDRIANSIANYDPEDDLLLRFMDGDGEDLDIRADSIRSENIIIAYFFKTNAEELFISEIFSNLTAEHFSQSHARDVFVAARSLYDRKATISIENIQGVLDKKDISINVESLANGLLKNSGGGIHYLGDITFHAERIIEAWILIKSVEIFKRSLKESAEGNRKSLNIISETTSALMRLVDSGGKNAMYTAAEAVRLVKKVMSESEHGVFQTVQQTGLDFLDDLIMGLPKREITIVAGRPSQGKGQPPQTPIATPWGTKTYGDLQKGDFVFDSRGLPTMVRNVYHRGVMSMYKVKFGDGTEEIVSGDHIWAVNNRAKRKRKDQRFVLKSTEELIDKVRTYDGRPNYYIPPTPEVNYPAKELKIDPYVLGVILADGGITTSTITVTTGDDWVVQECNKYLPEDHVIRHKHPNVPEYEYAMFSNYKRNQVTIALEEYGLMGHGSWTKFIPEDYLKASVEQRVALLQGLMDSDGTVNTPGTSARYTTASVQLADDIMELIRSLGGYTTRAIRTLDFGGSEKEYQRIYASFPNKPDWKPFRLPRKADAYEHYTKEYYGKPIESIEKIEDDYCVCIEVAADDGLYLTNNYNVTHNTAFALKLAYSVADNAQEEGAVVIFSAEMTASQLMARMISTKAQVNSKYIRDIRNADIEDRIKIEQAAEYIAENIHIYIDETPNPTPQYISAKLSAIASRMPIHLIVLDYAELGGTDQEDAWSIPNKSLRLEENLKKYKIIAKNMDAPFVVISQLSRAVEDRANANVEPIPRMADLRWSGMIEQIANVIIMVYYPWFFYNSGIPYNEVPAKDYYELLVVKNREGEVGTIPARFIKEYGDFQALPAIADDEDEEKLAWE